MDIEKSDLIRKITKNIYLLETHVLAIKGEILRRSYRQIILANNIYYTEYTTTQGTMIENEDVIQTTHTTISILFDHPEQYNTKKQHFYSFITKLGKDQLALLNDYLSSHI